MKKITRKRFFKCVIGLLILFAGPILYAGFGPVSFGKDWRTAPRHSTGVAPLPAENPEAIIQAYAARAFNWRGMFAVHTWIATKEAGAEQYQVHQVIGWRRFRNLPVRVSKSDIPDRSWYGSSPELLIDIRGAKATELIPKVKSAVQSYPYANEYRVWPGPNSNTFVSWVARQVPELRLDLPVTAIGKDYLANGELFDRAPSGTGYQASVLGLFGITMAKYEGIELNLFGLNFGLDPLRPAIKLPGIGRIGFDGELRW